MLKILRIGHVTLTTPDLARAKEYYTRIVGLHVAAENSGSLVLATSEGLEAVSLQRGEAAGLAGISFQIDQAADEAAVRRALAAAGLVGETVSDVTPGIRSAVRFKDPWNSFVDVFSDYRFFAPNEGPGGLRPLRLGHVARAVTDVKKAVDFYANVLGFRISDRRTDVGAFLRCGPEHHTINISHGPRDEIAHIAFEAKDAAELNMACDFLARHGFRLDWGPSRHNIGHNLGAYHHAPDGLRVELYAEMDRMSSEELGYFDPRPWHEDRPQRPKTWPLETSKNYWGP